MFREQQKVATTTKASDLIRALQTFPEFQRVVESRGEFTLRLRDDLVPLQDEEEHELATHIVKLTEKMDYPCNNLNVGGSNPHLVTFDIIADDDMPTRRASTSRVAQRWLSSYEEGSVTPGGWGYDPGQVTSQAPYQNTGSQSPPARDRDGKGVAIPEYPRLDIPGYTYHDKSPAFHSNPPGDASVPRVRMASDMSASALLEAVSGAMALMRQEKFAQAGKLIQPFKDHWCYGKTAVAISNFYVNIDEAAYEEISMADMQRLAMRIKAALWEDTSVSKVKIARGITTNHYSKDDMLRAIDDSLLLMKQGKFVQASQMMYEFMGVWGGKHRNTEKAVSEFFHAIDNNKFNMAAMKRLVVRIKAALQEDGI